MPAQLWQTADPKPCGPPARAKADSRQVTFNTDEETPAAVVPQLRLVELPPKAKARPYPSVPRMVTQNAPRPPGVTVLTLPEPAPPPDEGYPEGTALRKLHWPKPDTFFNMAADDSSDDRISVESETWSTDGHVRGPKSHLQAPWERNRAPVAGTGSGGHWSPAPTTDGKGRWKRSANSEWGSSVPKR